MSLLYARALPPLLAANNTDGVKLSLLMTSKGALLGSAGSVITDVSGKEVSWEAIAAIVSNIWCDFGDNDSAVGQSLEVLAFELQVGNVTVRKICGEFFVCCIAEIETPTHLINAKLEKLCKILDKELSKLDVSS